MPTVEIRYAGVVVARGELEQEADASTAFVASSEPLPVGTTVHVVAEGSARRSARVARTVEGGEACGMSLRWLEADTDGVPEPVASEVSTETSTDVAEPSGPRKTSAWGVPADLADAKRKAQGNGGGGGGGKKKKR